MLPVVSQRKNREEHIWEEGCAKDPRKSAFDGLTGGLGESRGEEGPLMGDSSGAKQRSPGGLPSHHGLSGGFRFCVMTLRMQRSITHRAANPSHPLHYSDREKYQIVTAQSSSLYIALSQ